MWKSFRVLVCLILFFFSLGNFSRTIAESSQTSAPSEAPPENPTSPNLSNSSPKDDNPKTDLKPNQKVKKEPSPKKKSKHQTIRISDKYQFTFNPISKGFSLEGNQNKTIGFLEIKNKDPKETTIDCDKEKEKDNEFQLIFPDLVHDSTGYRIGMEFLDYEHRKHPEVGFCEYRLFFNKNIPSKLHAGQYSGELRVATVKSKKQIIPIPIILNVLRINQHLYLKKFKEETLFLTQRMKGNSINVIGKARLVVENGDVKSLSLLPDSLNFGEHSIPVEDIEMVKPIPELKKDEPTDIILKFSNIKKAGIYEGDLTFVVPGEFNRNGMTKLHVVIKILGEYEGYELKAESPKDGESFTVFKDEKSSAQNLTGKTILSIENGNLKDVTLETKILSFKDENGKEISLDDFQITGTENLDFRYNRQHSIKFQINTSKIKSGIYNGFFQVGLPDQKLKKAVPIRLTVNSLPKISFLSDQASSRNLVSNACWFGILCFDQFVTKLFMGSSIPRNNTINIGIKNDQSQSIRVKPNFFTRNKITSELIAGNNQCHSSNDNEASKSQMTNKKEHTNLSLSDDHRICIESINIQAHQTGFLPIHLTPDQILAGEYSSELQAMIETSSGLHPSSLQTLKFDLNFRNGPFWVAITLLIGIFLGILAQPLAKESTKLHMQLLDRVELLGDEAHKLLDTQKDSKTRVFQILKVQRREIVDLNNVNKSTVTQYEKTFESINYLIQKILLLQILLKNTENRKPINLNQIKAIEEKIDECLEALEKDPIKSKENLVSIFGKEGKIIGLSFKQGAPIGQQQGPATPSINLESAFTQYEKEKKEKWLGETKQFLKDSWKTNRVSKWTKKTFFSFFTLVTGDSKYDPDFTHKILRPLLSWILMLSILLIGFKAQYIDKSTFGKSGIFDYFGALMWGFSTKVTQATLQNYFVSLKGK